MVIDISDNRRFNSNSYTYKHRNTASVMDDGVDCMGKALGLFLDQAVKTLTHKAGAGSLFFFPTPITRHSVMNNNYQHVGKPLAQVFSLPQTTMLIRLRSVDQMSVNLQHCANSFVRK